MDGDCESVDGDFEWVDGDCESVDGDFEWVDGDYESVDGDFEWVDGEGISVVHHVHPEFRLKISMLGNPLSAFSILITAFCTRISG